MRIFSVVMAVVMWITPVWAQDRDAIEDVISSQLGAFTDRDVDTAFSYASPMIQNMFGTPENFGRMVENGYPMVWDNQAPAFQELEGEGALVMQRVYVSDADGAGWILSYTMLETEAGWKINGVSVVPAPELSA